MDEDNKKQKFGGRTCRRCCRKHVAGQMSIGWAPHPGCFPWSFTVGVFANYIQLNILLLCVDRNWAVSGISPRGKYYLQPTLRQYNSGFKFKTTINDKASFLNNFYRAGDGLSVTPGVRFWSFCILSLRRCIFAWAALPFRFNTLCN